MNKEQNQSRESNGSEDLRGPAIPQKVSRNVNKLRDEKLNFGQRAADALANQAGSWKFIFTFAAVLAVWMFLNSVAFFVRNWDPYPFILLNLVLSCLAAIQAPVIMMSQNRQEQRDRLKADADFDVNVKAEAEVERLHRKLDNMHERLERLYRDQIKELLSLQQEQMNILGGLSGKGAAGGGSGAESK